MLSKKSHENLWKALGYVDGTTPDDPPQREIDEIAKRVKEIRDGWTAREREARAVCQPEAWSVPEYYTEYVQSDPGNFSRRADKRTKIYRRLPG